MNTYGVGFCDGRVLVASPPSELTYDEALNLILFLAVSACIEPDEISRAFLALVNEKRVPTLAELRRSGS